MAADSSTYDDATQQRRYAMAQALLAPPANPIINWAQGLDELGKGALGGYQIAQLGAERKAEKASEKADLYTALGLPAPAPAAAAPTGFAKIAALLSGGGQGAPAPPVAAPVAPPPTAPVPVIPAPVSAAPAGPVPAPPPPVAGPRPEVLPTSKVWGDKEAEAAGLYEPTPAGQKIAAALTPAPVTGPTDVSAAAKPPTVSTAPGILADTSAEKKAQIAQMLSSRNPQVKAIGQALMTQALASSDTPKYDFKTAGDSLYRTNAKTGTAEPIRDVGRSVQPMTPEQRKTWNVPEGMSAGIDDNGKPVFSPPGTNINLNTAQSGTKAMQEKAIEDFQTAQTSSRDAVKRSQIWDKMEEAAKGFTPGATADVKLTAKRYLKDAGIIAGEDVPDAEVFKQMQQQIAIHAQPKGQGAVSNVERELFAKAIPNITMSPEGLSRSIQISRGLDSYDRKVAQVYRDNAKKNGGIPNSVEVNEEIEKLGSPLTVGDTNYLQKASKGEPATVASAAPAPVADAGRAALETEMRKRGLLK